MLADKGYDDTDIIEYIAKSLKAKASIPIKETNQRISKRRSQLSVENRIKGGYLNWKLKAKGRSLKKSIYNKRSEVERFFSTLKRAFHIGKDEVKLRIRSRGKYSSKRNPSPSVASIILVPLPFFAGPTKLPLFWQVKIFHPPYLPQALIYLFWIN